MAAVSKRAIAEAVGRAAVRARAARRTGGCVPLPSACCNAVHHLATQRILVQRSHEGCESYGKVSSVCCHVVCCMPTFRCPTRVCRDARWCRRWEPAGGSTRRGYGSAHSPTRTRIRCRDRSVSAPRRWRWGRCSPKHAAAALPSSRGRARAVRCNRMGSALPAGHSALSVPAVPHESLRTHAALRMRLQRRTSSTGHSIASPGRCARSCAR